MKILFIDDDPMTLEMLSLVANASGFNALSNLSATAGFEMAVEQQPEVIILDYNMPEMTGVEVLKKIRSHSIIATTPVLMLSASSKTEFVDAFYAAGGQKYITKPMDLDEFFEVIRDHAK